ncbi:hypothetical protein diail_2052 [Diaporthe ilicicola]|nr:hypothetical protein diail_2052 [Diaporthe ilicicola]
MPPAIDEDLVADDDRPYFIAATTVLLRQQLHHAGLPINGRKYDLYTRLMDNGLKLYTDNRVPPSGDSSGHSADNSSNGSQPGGSPPPPAPKKLMMMHELPVELAMTVVENLDGREVWNLITADPGEFLGARLNVLVLEAQHRMRDGDNGDEQSLLEWVGERVSHDAGFRGANVTRIRLILNIYLQQFPNDNPPQASRVDNIMWYFRPRGDILPDTPTIVAAQLGNPNVVNLLLLSGANPNVIANGRTALDEAVAQADCNVPGGMGHMRVIFALIGGGANVALVNPASQFHAQSLLRVMVFGNGFNGNITQANLPRIHNILGLTIPQFLADERSDLFDRVIVALAVVTFQNLTYTNFH